MRERDAASILWLDGVPWSEVGDLLAPCAELNVDTGTMLAERGHGEDRVWLVLEGALAVYAGPAEQASLTTAGPGQTVGELAAIDGGPRSATVVAARPSRVVEIEGAIFRAVLARSHRASLNLLVQVSRRVRETNAALETRRRAQEQLRRQSLVDPLTGLHNRRWLDEMLVRLVTRAAQGAEPLSVVMVDIDHFKRLNDGWGHPAGDVALVAVANELRRRVRPTDAVARYGGEEFAIVLPRTGADEAVIAADRFREAIAFCGIVLPDGTTLPRVTVSCGVAALQGGETAAALLARADEALYAAKNAGRNRVHRWGL
jgi:diguanylate cyclase (GGDEF)-like protein